MSLTDSILLFLCFLSIWLPVLVAILARRSPVGVRVVLALSGVLSGIYAASVHSRITHASGHDRGWGVLLIPFTTAALSFYVAFTGVCLVTALSYVLAGRALSPPSLFAFALVVGSIVLGVVVVFPFVTAPLL